MTREAVTVAALPHRAPWRRVQRTLRLAALAFLLWSTAGAPALVHAQWLGLPDPPDPPDEVDCVACTGEAEGPAPAPPTPAPTPQGIQAILPPGAGAANRVDEIDLFLNGQWDRLQDVRRRR